MYEAFRKNSIFVEDTGITFFTSQITSDVSNFLVEIFPSPYSYFYE